LVEKLHLNLIKDEPIMKVTKETVVANLYLMKIHLLILKLFIIKEVSSWMMKILH
jgi:hypothetical protein